VLLEKFQQDFPDAYDIEWETNDEIYEVEFEISHRDFDAYYDLDGNLFLYREEIKKDGLPAAVGQAVAAKYPTHRFDDVEKIVAGAVTFYKIELKSAGKEVVVYVTGEGTFVSQTGQVLPDAELPPAEEVTPAPNPVPSTVYTNEEIAALIQNYRNTPERDIRVDGLLLEKFQQDFTGAYDIEWETGSELYEVEFEINHRDFEAFYDKDGNLLSWKQEIREAELPAAVKDVAAAKYPTCRFDDVEKIITGTETSYKVEMEAGKTEVTLLITDAGVIVSEKTDR
jgi:hypothetical protein